MYLEVGPREKGTTCCAPTRMNTLDTPSVATLKVVPSVVSVSSASGFSVTVTLPPQSKNPRRARVLLMRRLFVVKVNVNWTGGLYRRDCVLVN